MKKLRALFFALTVATLFVAVTSRSHAQVAPSSTAIAGAVSHGVALALSTKSSAVTLGTPITITIEIKNLSGRTLILQTPQVASAYAYSVVDLSTGKVVPQRPPSRTGDDVYGGLNMHVGRGESFTVNVRLDEMVQLDSPGKYRVDVSTKFILNRETMKDLAATSNSITIDVTR